MVSNVILESNVGNASNVSIVSNINVVVPNETKLTVATCNWTRVINQLQTIRVGVNGGILPCVWLDRPRDFRRKDDKQPH